MELESKFRRNLLIGFGISLLLLIVSSVASYTSIRNLLTSADLVEHTNLVMQQLSYVNINLKAAETGQRGYLLTDKEEFLDPYRGASDSARANLANVKQLTINDPQQQQTCRELEEVVIYMLKLLERLIEKKKMGEQVTFEELQQGRQYMMQVQSYLKLMADREKTRLAERTARMNRLSTFTPFLIVVAAFLGIIITVISYVRVSRDYETRTRLQRELQAKDEDITRRINIIREVANQVSGGKYDIRVADEGEDGLGNLSFSLNRMAESLQYSFNLLSEKEWLQTGIAKLNEKMLGENDMNTIGRIMTEFIVGYTKCQAGAFYLAEDGNFLRFVNGFAFDTANAPAHIHFGAGIVGECARTGKMIHLENVPDNLVIISHITGTVKAAHIIALPLHHENHTVGVIELAGINAFTEPDKTFLEAIAHIIGTVVYMVENRKKLQELLEETQSQAEELQAQHNEMENMNSELGIQTEKLQASEEELKVQQEELLEANQELEERARMLEEKNQMVFERNLEIQKKAEELALSTRYKSEFLANMSHELRTPLNSILLLSRLMAENSEKNLTEEQVEYARVILSSGNGLLSLIDEILDLSRIEAGKMELQYEEAPVLEVVRIMQDLFIPVAREKEVTFNVSIEEGTPVSIETDKKRLEQIIKNLISNALKFTAEGGVVLVVEAPADKPGYIAFSVKDSGIGIPHEKQQLIFDAFRQADGSTRRKYGGTGLGLSISRELAKLLRGEISLKSDPGEGSVFTLLIPVSKDIAESSQAAEDAKQDILLPFEADNSGQPGEKDAVEQRYLSDVIPQNIPDDREDICKGDEVILIVEDDTGFARSLLEFTRQRHYKGIVTVRGDEAVALAVKYKPAGILLDIQLPVKDGWEVMEELKNNPLTKHIPVHIMSSFEEKYKGLAKGAVDYIYKPVGYEKMQDVFRKIEFMIHHNPRKVLIVEENITHARALSFYLESFRISAEIKSDVEESIRALQDKEVNCVILDMGIPDHHAYETLEKVKQSPGLESVPIIIFTGKSLSRVEELRIKQYADSIVIKTAHSYQRILDEVSLFLHVVEGSSSGKSKERSPGNLGALRDVLKGKTILVADDDVRNIYALTRSLENPGMKVLSAIDGKDALKVLEANPGVDIVLMDMMMPEMDGYESIREIKASRKFNKIPVIAVTAKAMTGDREKCINAGASDYITKPVDIDQLLSLLRVWLYDIG